MNQGLSILIAALLGTTLLGACSKSGPGPSFSDKIDTDAQHARHIPTRQGVVVTDVTGTPVSHAQVLIGQREGVPFADNYITADGAGRVAIPSGWKDKQPVTIAADG